MCVSKIAKKGFPARRVAINLDIKELLEIVSNRVFSVSESLSAYSMLQYYFK